MPKSYIGHYECKDSVNGMLDDRDYSIDWACEKMYNYAIWCSQSGGMAWAFAPFKTQKSAFEFLNKEFEFVRKHIE